MPFPGNHNVSYHVEVPVRDYPNDTPVSWTRDFECMGKAKDFNHLWSTHSAETEHECHEYMERYKGKYRVVLVVESVVAERNNK